MHLPGGIANEANIARIAEAAAREKVSRTTALIR
jgi:hypothetical protein